MDRIMSQYKHPYLSVKLNKAKSDFDYFMTDMIKNYNQNAFKLSEKLSGITCIRRYAAFVYHKDLLAVLAERITLNDDEKLELESNFNKQISVDWSVVPDCDDEGNLYDNGVLLSLISEVASLSPVYIRYLQRLHDSVELFQYHNRKIPYQIELNIRESIKTGAAIINVSMIAMDCDTSQFIYESESKKFYKKDIDRAKFEYIHGKYPELNFEIFKLLHRHIYQVLSTRIIPSIDLLELNKSSKKSYPMVSTLFSPSELLAYDEKGDLSELVEDFIKKYPFHKEEMKRAIEILKYEYGLIISNTQQKIQDNIIDKEYLVYELGLK